MGPALSEAVMAAASACANEFRASGSDWCIDAPVTAQPTRWQQGEGGKALGNST